LAIIVLHGVCMPGTYYVTL